MSRIEIIDQLIEKVYKQLEKLDDEPLELSFEEFDRRRTPYYAKLDELSRERRLLMIPEFEEIPDYGDRMKIDEFIESVKEGILMDYDGSGNYLKDDKMSNITIYPSDVSHNAIRKDFDAIIWFNK